MEVRFDQLVCGDCKSKPAARGVVLDYMSPNVQIPGSDGRPPRKAGIKVLRVSFANSEGGALRGHLIARVPCMNCEDVHEVDVTDLYHAPQVHLKNASRCRCGETMDFDKTPSWTYEDDGEHGGRIEVTGTLKCSKCHETAVDELRAQLSDMEEALKRGSIDIDLATAARTPSS